jgi:hypothetical protein
MTSSIVRVVALAAVLALLSLSGVLAFSAESAAGGPTAPRDQAAYSSILASG